VRFASLGSGSKGNATVVEYAGTRLLIDCGFSVKETKRRLERLAIQPESIDAILVTHEHGDHLKGAMPFSRRYDTPVYMTPGTAKQGKVDGSDYLKMINCHQNFSIGGLSVQPVPVPHDAREPCQFLFEAEKNVLGVLTDLGSLSSHVISEYKQCDALLLEANHDLDMLSRGTYPPSLKRRVGGVWGHLNNQQTMTLLEYVDASRLNHLVLGHISEQNNSPELVKQALRTCPKEFAEVTYAQQNFGFDWISVCSS
jgi:phosphoribosyl 1,2-cyclic phosphodiesterase